MDITQLAEYGPAAAEFQQAKRAAVSAGDELALAKAESAWSQKQLELRDIADRRNSEAMALQSARAEAKQKYPQAPEPAYARLSSPEDILAAAKEAHEAIHAALSSQAKADAGANPTSWGSPPPTGAANGAGDPGSDNPDDQMEARLRELEPEVRKGNAGDPQARQEFNALWFDRAIGSRFTPNSKWTEHKFPIG